MENTTTPQSINEEEKTTDAPVESTPVETPDTPPQPSADTDSTSRMTPAQEIDHVTQDYQEKVQNKVSSEKLLDGLYWIWDAFERANVHFFLVGQTAEDAIANKDLSGHAVEVGVRKNEWIAGGRRIIDAFITPKEEEEMIVLYEHEGVPVILKVYEDSDCVRQTDTIMYRYERFQIPNPMSTFKELYG